MFTLYCKWGLIFIPLLAIFSSILYNNINHLDINSNDHWLMNIHPNESVLLCDMINNRLNYPVKTGNKITRENSVFSIRNQTIINSIKPLIERSSKYINIPLYISEKSWNTITIIEYIKGDYIVPHKGFKWTNGDKVTIFYEINNSSSYLTFLTRNNTQKSIMPKTNEVGILITSAYTHWVPKLEYGNRIVVLIEVFTNEEDVSWFYIIVKYLFDKLIF